MMLTSLVYLAEHWVIDGLVGLGHRRRFLLVLDWQEARRRRVRAERSIGVLATL